MDKLGAIGFLGGGNMGGALIRGLLATGLKPECIYLHDTSDALMQRWKKDYKISLAPSAQELFQNCDTLVLAVKPQIFTSAIAEISLANNKTKLIVSVMAGISSVKIRGYFTGLKVVRVMPNLPLSVGEGATAIESDGLSEDVLQAAEALFQCAGKSVRVTAAQMDAVTGLSGSGPMYVFEFIEGLILGGVKSGLSREVSVTLALQTVMGAVKLLESSTETPAQWSAKVCSPGGTTIHALHILEQNGFKATLISAVEAAVKRSKELGA